MRRGGEGVAKLDPRAAVRGIGHGNVGVNMCLFDSDVRSEVYAPVLDAAAGLDMLGLFPRGIT